MGGANCQANHIRRFWPGRAALATSLLELRNGLPQRTRTEWFDQVNLKMAHLEAFELRAALCELTRPGDALVAVGAGVGVLVAAT